jgi:hypothetical protein
MPSPTPAELAASLVASESDNLQIQRLIQEAIAARSVLTISLLNAPTATEAGYFEALDKLVVLGTVDPLVEIIAIEQLRRTRVFTAANWRTLLEHLLRLASATRNAYASAILAQLGPE